MKPRERIMAVLRHEEPDFVPVTIYTSLMPRGYGERELRNMGLCLVEMGVSVYGIKTPKVKVQTAQDLASFNIDDRYSCIAKQKQTIERTYVTPVGNLSEKYKWNYTLFEWPVEWPIKTPQDYEIAKYVIDDTEYFLDEKEYVKTERILGDDGIMALGTPRSPLQSMLLELMGYERFSIDYHTYTQEFEDLYRVFRKKQLELYKVVADSAAEVVLLGDNINGIVTNPRLYEKYCLPFYEDVARVLHNKGKIFGVHCDGKLNCLKRLIEKAQMDVIEGFTPPPIGDVTIQDARAAWKGKTLWTNFPATLAMETTLDRIRHETIGILREAAPGDDFALGMTEDLGDIKSIHYEEILKAITETIMKHGKYPIGRV